MVKEENLVTNAARENAEKFLAEELAKLTPGFDTRPAAKAFLDLDNVTHATMARWDKEGHLPTSMSLEQYNDLRTQYGYPPIKEIN